MDQENKHLTFFKNFTIKHKLIANNILLIVTIIFLAIFSSFKLGKIGGMLNDTTGKITDITEISKFITEIEALVSNTALQAMVGSEFDPAKAKEKNNEYLAMCMERIEDIAQKSTIENSLKSYQKSSNKFYDMIIEGNYLEAADVATKELTPLMQSLKDESDRIVTASITATSERNQELKERLGTDIVFISLASLIAIILSVTIAIYVIMSISSGLKDVIDRLKDIAKGDGDLTKKLSDNRNDELGELARWFNRFVDKIHGIVQDVASHASTLSQSSFDLSTSSNQLASNAEEMSTQSNIVASSTEQTSSNIESIASFAEEMSTSVNTVASAIEELSASLNEVAKNCQKESQIALQADTQAKNTRSQMGHLDDAAKEIGKVIDTINDIADQTNLLALNATIEAASAGEAGSGFAVVANEVKELAKQTAQATGVISTQIEQIQSIANGSVLSIQEIATIIDEVNTISQTIVAAVEEQSATVNEISNNTGGASNASNDIASKVQESASSMKEVSSNIQSVNIAAQDTTKGVQQIKINVEELATLAGSLKKVVEQFKI